MQMFFKKNHLNVTWRGIEGKKINGCPESLKQIKNKWSFMQFSLQFPD